MATGDVTGSKRPRYAANERFDVGDADAASRAPVEGDEALQRALLSTPRAAGGAVPTGLIFTGFSLTLNPTGPTDNKVRINTELGVAVDANGRYVVKPAGVTVDVTIPAGNQQVYIYWSEVAGDTAQRRFLTVTSPFTEYPAAMLTTFQATYGLHVRAGTAANMVADDTVNGVTTPLVCLACVTNTAGTITIAGYHATDAPNGTAIINRLANVEVPATLPTRTKNGSARTLHDLVTTNAYMRGRALFLGAESTLTAYATTSSAVAALEWTEAGATWVVDELIGCVLEDSAGVFWLIASNTATVLTLSGFLSPSGGVTAAGTPTGGAGTIYGPIAGNNFGAYTQPSKSLQQLVDHFGNYFNAPGNLVMPSGTSIALPANTFLSLNDNSAYVHAHGTLFMGRQRFTGSGTYTPTAGTRRVVVRMCGGGGGGGGCGTTAAGTGAAGGGGASGHYFEQVIAGSPIAGGAVTIGGAGGGGVGAAAGGAGGDTSVVINGVTYTAAGGGGGSAGTNNLSPPALENGGTPGGGSSAGDFTKADPGDPGIITGNAGGEQSKGGTGGSGGFGTGGNLNGSGNGVSASGFGAGGSGASAYNGSGPFNGGSGTAGIVIIDEYR